MAKDATPPFRVKARDIHVEVSDTHFNVNAYSDEDAVRAMLPERSVKTILTGQQILLKPGQQRLINNTGNPQLNTNTDIDKIMAWRNNDFDFQNDDIKIIMKQLARWYDVELLYEKSEMDKSLFAVEFDRQKDHLGTYYVKDPVQSPGLPG